ncbi:unnamed protein product, partial [Staurois parvus]
MRTVHDISPKCQDRYRIPQMFRKTVTDIPRKVRTVQIFRPNFRNSSDNPPNVRDMTDIPQMSGQYRYSPKCQKLEMSELFKKFGSADSP